MPVLIVRFAGIFFQRASVSASPFIRSASAATVSRRFHARSPGRPRRENFSASQSTKSSAPIFHQRRNTWDSSSSGARRTASIPLLSSPPLAALSSCARSAPPHPDSQPRSMTTAVNRPITAPAADIRHAFEARSVRRCTRANKPQYIQPAIAKTNPKTKSFICLSQSNLFLARDLSL